MVEKMQDFQDFVEKWKDGREGNKRAFLQLKEILAACDDVVLEFKARPGVSYSLRARHRLQRQKPLFVMFDVIEGEPRWLSVCFYAQMIQDPEERGDFIPGGLLGEDAICFDLEQYSDDGLHYLEKRLAEAYVQAVDG